MLTSWRADFVPFPLVPERTEGIIQIESTGMPNGIDSEALSLNVSALRAGVVALGGYESLRLYAYSGDVSDISPMPSGVDAGGAATAARSAAATKAKVFAIDSVQDSEKNAVGRRNGTLRIGWNIRELDSLIRISERINPDVRARQLDDLVRTAAVRGVWRHNTSEALRDIAQHEPRIIMGDIGFWLVTAVTNLMLIEPNNLYDATNITASAISVSALRLFVRLQLIEGRDHNITREDIKECLHEPFSLTVRPTLAAAASMVLQQRLIKPTPAKSIR